MRRLITVALACTLIVAGACGTETQVPPNQNDWGNNQPDTKQPTADIKVCNAGAVYCQNNVLFTCNQTGTTWGQVNCQLGCQSNICKSGCQEGQNVCINQTQLQICGQGGQLSLQNCANGCQNNQCVGGVEKICTGGETFCQNDILFTCKPDGAAWIQVACQFGCQNSVCKGNCQPGTQTCKNQKQLQLCDVNGNITLKTCIGFCQNNQCSEDVPLCDPNKHFCSQGGKHVYLCAADGKSAAPVKSCPFGCDPQTVQCKSSACQVGETRCAPDNPNFVESCMPDQSGWIKAPTPCKDGCVEGQCFQPACAAGAQKCGSTGIMECKPDKTGYFLKEKCEGGCIIEGNNGMPKCGECMTGAKKCNWYTVQQCKNPTEGWVDFQDCGESETCAEGECVNMVYMDASNSKEQNYLILVSAMGECLHIGQNGACTGLQTKAISYGITESDLTSWFCDNDKYKDEAFKATFKDSQTFEYALDVMGCEGFLTNLKDLTIQGGSIKPGLDGKQCIAFSSGTFNGKEVVVDYCENF